MNGVAAVVATPFFYFRNPFAVTHTMHNNYGN